MHNVHCRVHEWIGTAISLTPGFLCRAPGEEAAIVTLARALPLEFTNGPRGSGGDSGRYFLASPAGDGRGRRNKGGQKEATLER